MSGTRSDTQPHNNIEALHSSAMTSVPPNTSHAGAVSDADNYMQVNFHPPRHHHASVPQIPSPARTLLDMPRLGAAGTTASIAGPSGLDVLNTAVEARTDPSREEAALALVGLTTALPPPPTGIAPANHNNGNTCGSASSVTTPRPPATSAAQQQQAAAPTSVVTPGSSGTSKPRGKLTYVKGVGLVSGEISDELIATLAAASSRSPETPAPTKRTPAPQKDTRRKKTKGTSKRARGGSAAKKGDSDTAVAAPAATVVTPAPASAKTPTHPGVFSLQLRTDGWTNYELGRLVQGMHYHDQDWEAIGTFVGTRSAWQCRTKWEDRTEWEGRWREENGRFLMEESPDAGGKTASANTVQTPRSPKKMAKKKSPGRPRKQPSTAADGSKSPTKAPKKKPQKTNKDGSSPSRPTYSREKLVTADGKNKGDWNDDETARLQQGIQVLGSNWRDIAERYVKTRTKQQCKSKNQKMVRSDGEDWHTKTFLSLKKVRRPLSEPASKRALKVDVDGMMDPPVEKREKVSKKRGPRKDGRGQLKNLPSLPPLPPAVPMALPPLQYEEKEVEAEKEQTRATVAVDSDAPPADAVALNPPEPPPRQDAGDASGRRLSKRRPKRSVAEIREEFEAKQDMKPRCRLRLAQRSGLQPLPRPRPLPTSPKLLLNQYQQDRRDVLQPRPKRLLPRSVRPRRRKSRKRL